MYADVKCLFSSSWLLNGIVIENIKPIDKPIIIKFFILSLDIYSIFNPIIIVDKTKHEYIFIEDLFIFSNNKIV